MYQNEIAETLGSYDEAYFCRCFRRDVGISPGRYIKNRQI